MSLNTKEILSLTPKWLFVGAFCVFVVCFIASFFFGTFMIAGYEFGYSGTDGKAIKQSRDTIYTVKGTVGKDDNQLPIDVMIVQRYPPLYPSGDGVINGLDVWRDPNGKFPILAFCHEGYTTEAIDLNDQDKVKMEEDNTIRIRERVTLKLIPHNP